MPNHTENQVIPFDTAETTHSVGVVNQNGTLAKQIAGALIKYNQFVDIDMIPLECVLVDDTTHIMERAAGHLSGKGIVGVLWNHEFIHLVRQCGFPNDNGSLTLNILIRS